MLIFTNVLVVNSDSYNQLTTNTTFNMSLNDAFIVKKC